MTASVPAILKFLSNNQDYPMNQNINMAQRAKKRRLDHLSWEEKVQRKKLKNRVAAQTSRDRKKAKMEQMEQALQQLFSQNEALSAECENLKVTNQRLTEENAELYSRLQAPCENCTQSRTVECEVQNGSTVSTLQPQGRTTHSAAALNKQSVAVLWKIILTCLLYRISSTNSTPMSTLIRWSNLRRASFKISPETWRQLLRKQIVKNQSVIDKRVLERWWGRHQRSWNPMEVTC
uniref:X-box-binding protein 1 n=1 Tax=Anoplophora glabripennis TaxID=217634 RepID=V5I8Z0_ANOGL